MIDHNDPNKKPFQIGQLVKSKYEYQDEIFHGISLVLDIEWFPGINEWKAYVLNQKTGMHDITWSVHFVPVGYKTGSQPARRSNPFPIKVL